MEWDFLARVNHALHAAALPGKAQKVPASQRGVRVVKPVANKINATRIDREHLPVLLEAKPKLFGQKRTNRFSGSVELLFIRSKEHHVIHISDVVFYTGQCTDESVEGLKKEICKPLVDVVADGKTAVRV